MDDEVLVLLAASEYLADAGFTVLEAAAAEPALSLLFDHPETALVFTDINMPGRIDGVDLAYAVRAMRPDIKVVLTSGRVSPAASELPPGALFVEKPYSIANLGALFRQMVCDGPHKAPLFAS